MPKARPENDLWFAPFTTSISLPQPIGQRSHVVSVGNRRGKLSVSNPSAPIIRKVGEAIWKKVASNKHARITNKPASFVVETTQAMMHDGENVLNRLKTLADATKYPPRKKGETMAPYRSVSDDAIFSFMQIRNMVTGASTMTASTTMTHATLTVSDYPPTASQTAIDQIRADPNHVIYHIAGRPPPIQPQRMVNHRSVVKTTNERKQLKRLADHKAERIRGSDAQLAALLRDGVPLRMHMQFTFHSKSEKACVPIPKTTAPDIDNIASGAKLLLPHIPTESIVSFSADKRIVRTPKLDAVDPACINKSTAAGVFIYICKN